jgi:hypothetical protein
MAKINITGATVPYQLRPHKAIERNLFIDLLKVLDAANNINFSTYRYVGFGAAFLEDFKAFHLELGIQEMDSIEMNKFAHTRQEFNNPYYFLTPYLQSSTDYIVGENFKDNLNQIIWLDYSNCELRQQLMDIELLAAKMNNLDVLKLTFNTKLQSFIFKNNVLSITDPAKKCGETDIKSLLKFLNDDPTYQQYLPGKITVKDIKRFSDLVRAMAVRAINRGLAKNNNRDLKFHHIAAFLYADGQEMSTVTGLIAEQNSFTKVLRQSKLKKWKFYKKPSDKSELLSPIEIAVPAMTVSERIEIDRQIPSADVKTMAEALPFFYGSNEPEHLQLIEGYHTFYKYLPYYSKVIY